MHFISRENYEHAKRFDVRCIAAFIELALYPRQVLHMIASAYHALAWFSEVKGLSDHLPLGTTLFAGLDAGSYGQAKINAYLISKTIYNPGYCYVLCPYK